MKAYLYKKPSRVLPRVLFSPENPPTVYKAFALLVFFPTLFVLTPVALILVIVGEIGHAIAGALGLESRDWL